MVYLYVIPAKAGMTIIYQVIKVKGTNMMNR